MKPSAKSIVRNFIVSLDICFTYIVYRRNIGKTACNDKNRRFCSESGGKCILFPKVACFSDNNGTPNIDMISH